MKQASPSGSAARALFGAACRLWHRFAAGLHERSRAAVAFLEVRMEVLIAGWCAAVVTIGLAKVMVSPMGITGPAEFMAALLPYLLIALAPAAGYRVAAGSFPNGLLSAQPLVRLCRYGSWRPLDAVTARQNPAFGPVGFMASLLIGLMLNVPMRTLEFIMAVPAIAPGAPLWAETLVIAMTIDVMIMNFFYMVCFVLALRAVPLFPRMLLFAWTIDILLQLLIAQRMSASPSVPASVATALENLLNGNLQKVLISAALWLPYLILSERVNVTFRRRIRA